MYRPYGMQAYYSTLSTFAPALERRFWEAVRAGDLTSAREVILKYEVPFFERWSHAFWRATMEYFGIAQRFLRPPDPSFTPAQVAALGPFYKGLGLSREGS